MQIPSTQEFIRRSERRLVDLEAERTAESKFFEEARERFRKLEAARCAEEAVASPLPATLFVLETQVQTLQQMVNQLQAALAQEVKSGPVERPKVRHWVSVPHVAEDTIPPMPTLVLRTWRSSWKFVEEGGSMHQSQAVPSTQVGSDCEPLLHSGGVARSVRRSGI